MDASLISAGMNFLTSGMAAANQNKINKIQAETSNYVRGNNNKVVEEANKRNSVLTATQRWAQGVRNSRVYEAAGYNQEALAVNFNRARDARTRLNLAESIRQAEEQGRQQAVGAASGITGSVVDVINMTTSLRNGMQNTARIESEKQISHDYLKQESRQNAAVMDQLDYSVIFDNPIMMDFGTNTAQQYSAMSAGLAAGGKDLLTAASNFFKPAASSSLTSFLNVDYQQRGDN